MEPVLTVFLTNSECPYTCLMCDLWTHTLDAPLNAGQVLEQLDFALEAFPGPRHIKLYNAGNFLDRRAIPVQDRAAVASRLKSFETVVVENHPRMCSEGLLEFRQALDGKLEVAMGLETVHPEVLPRLNKQMTLDDFSRATERLLGWDIAVRTFVLLGLPWTDPAEYVGWAERSVDFARGLGCDVCSVIPTRAGNGVMDRLADEGSFHEPTLGQLEEIQARLLPGPGRTFVDLWDAERFSSCEECIDARVLRMRSINHAQRPLPRALCPACDAR